MSWISDLQPVSSSFYNFWTPGDDLYKSRNQIGESIYQDSLSLWAREDSAYQRMVADMKKAGLNPWSGVSSGGSPTSAVNPSMDSLSGVMSILSGFLQSTGVELDSVNSGRKLFDSVINGFAKIISPLIGGLM